MKKSFLRWGMSLVLLGSAVVGSAKGPVGMDVQVSHPRLKSGEKQTIYVKIGLMGYARDEKTKRAPVNVAIVLDKSGSMASGGKIEAAREAALTALNMLDGNDILSVVTYDSTVNVLVPATKVSDRETLERKIRDIKASGSTALFAGVSKGAEELRKFIEQERVSRVLLLSDGLANIGPSAPGELGDLGATLAREGVSVSTIGLGLDYNEDLMAQLASRSDGNHYFVENASKLAGIFEDAMGRAQQVVAQQIKIDIECKQGMRPVRVLGREAEIAGQHVRIDLNQLLAGHERAVLLEVEAPASEVGAKGTVIWAKAKYLNALNGKQDEAGGEAGVEYTDKAEEVEHAVNAVVMVPVVELIATENNQRAMLLRDQGQIADARKALDSNVYYLGENAAKYKSERLRQYQADNSSDAINLDPTNYKQQRKVMVEKQSQNTAK